MMDIWQQIDALEPAPCGNADKDWNLFVVYYSDKVIRIAPATERKPPGFEDHYRIGGMTPAGFIMVFRTETKQDIANKAMQKVAQYRAFDADHERYAKLTAGRHTVKRSGVGADA